MYIFRQCPSHTWLAITWTALMVQLRGVCNSNRSARSKLSYKTPANQPFWASSKSIKSRCDSDVGEAKRLENATIAASGTTGALDAYNDLLILSQDLSNQLALILQAHPSSSVREAAADCSQRLQGLLDRLTEGPRPL